MIEWLIDFNGMPNHQLLFYIKISANCVHCTSFNFFCVRVFMKFLQTVKWHQVFLSNTNYLHTVIWIQVFLSNISNYIASSNYFCLIIIICFHTVIWFQVFLSNINYITSSNYFYLIIIICLLTVIWFHWISNISYLTIIASSIYS